MASMAWWEQGALGVTYLTAPSWLHSAYGLISHERVKASQYRMELTKAK